MFEVNLLTPPPHQRPKDSIVITGAAAVSIVFIGLAVWSYVLITHVKQLRRDLAEASQEVVQLRTVSENVQRLKQNAERLRMRRDLLQQLLASQMPTSQILKISQSVIPRDVWLTSVTARGKGVTFEGYTFSYPSVARFMVELERSGSVRHIALSTSQREVVADREVVKFQITGDLVVAHRVTSQKEATP